MVKVTDLPPAIRETIFQHLPARSIQSASLAARAWSQLYKQYSCRTLRIDLSVDTVTDKTELLQKWEQMDLLRCVRQITLLDSGRRSPNGEELLHNFYDLWLPKLSGLKSVLWDISGNPEKEDAFHLTQLPSGAFLDLVCDDAASVQTISTALRAIQNLDNLRSLTVEFSEIDELELGSLLKPSLLGCRSLTALKINVISHQDGSDSYYPHDTDHTPVLTWTEEEAANLPALQHLDLHYPSLTAEMFEIWAKKSDWSSLRTLVAHHSCILDNLTGRLPALESLSVSTIESLPNFLASQPVLHELAIVDVQQPSRPKDITPEVHNILKLPFAADLKRLELRTALDDEELEQSPIDVKAIATSCPKLQELTMAVTSQQYKNAVGYFCWMDACIEAVVSMPNLLRIAINVPRVIPSGSLSIPPEILTLPDVANLWSKLTAHGKTLQEFRITASMASEKAETEREAAILGFLALPGPPSLTFVVTPAEKDWEAEQGAYKTSCPELEHSEDLLRRGHLTRLSETGEYSTARRTTDDISTYVYKGTIAPKKKIRPMPVWLTPEEEQDRREGPPSQSRRMKRALIRSVSDFAGVWRLPMTETSPRTAAERAESRENGFNGRAGWSKSSLAMRVFYRR
ncbi:hypothetical protein MBLNU13_g00116t1 [Cladosporium sp. NU13]